jgi:hypothetical protein
MEACRFLQGKLGSLGHQAGDVVVEVEQYRQQHSESIPSSANMPASIGKKK